MLGYASKDAGSIGAMPSAPAIRCRRPTTSTNAIRWAVGQLTAYRPEYAWVKIRVTSSTANITDPDGCPYLHGDTFGGDAGGTDNGKDHLWRYYEPTEIEMNLCVLPGKPADKELIKSGDTYQYPVKVYNLQAFSLTNVVVKDTLPSGVTFISAVPGPEHRPQPAGVERRHAAAGREIRGHRHRQGQRHRVCRQLHDGLLGPDASAIRM